MGIYKIVFKQWSALTILGKFDAVVFVIVRFDGDGLGFILMVHKTLIH